jgi:opacity protein-like surface antigen
MKRSILFAVLALTLSAPAAFAAKGEWTGGGQAGAHMPMGDYGDVAKTGWLGGVFIDYMMSDMLSIGGNLDYHSTKAKDDYITTTFPGAGVEDIDITVFNYGANLALHLSNTGAARPYLKGAFGAYNSKAEIKGGLFDGTDDSSTDMGIAGGAGVMFRPPGNSVGFGIEALYHNIFTEGDATQLFTVTGRINFSFSDMSQQ